MNDLNKSASKPGTNVFAKIGQFIGSQKLGLVAPIATAVLGVLGYWLYPLKQRVYDFLYPPRAIVDYELISLRNPMMRGDTFIVKLHLVPDGNSLAAGQIRTDIPADYLVLEEGNLLVDLDGNDKNKVLTYKFDAVKAGSPHLAYFYNFVRGGSVKREVEITVVDRQDGFPTFSDISGQWEVMWDKGLGELTIVQNATRLGGSFSLAEADSGHILKGGITGFSNGDNLRLILIPDPLRSSDKTARATMYANLLKVSGPHDLTICGHINIGKEEPFLGQIVDATASAQEICKGANLLAKAQLK